MLFEFVTFNNFISGILYIILYIILYNIEKRNLKKTY